jgi:hypothetical protein
MLNGNQQKTGSHVHKEWAEAYVDLQEDELMQRYVIYLQCHQAGRCLLEQSRQIWREHGLPTAPFDFILFETELGLRRKEYTGSEPTIRQSSDNRKKEEILCQAKPRSQKL